MTTFCLTLELYPHLVQCLCSIDRKTHGFSRRRQWSEPPKAPSWGKPRKESFFRKRLGQILIFQLFFAEAPVNREQNLEGVRSSGTRGSEYVPCVPKAFLDILAMGCTADAPWMHHVACLELGIPYHTSHTSGPNARPACYSVWKPGWCSGPTSDFSNSFHMLDCSVGRFGSKLLQLRSRLNALDNQVPFSKEIIRNSGFVSPLMLSFLYPLGRNPGNCRLSYILRCTKSQG